jgi:hypothetical protein
MDRDGDTWTVLILLGLILALILWAAHDVSKRDKQVASLVYQACQAENLAAGECLLRCEALLEGQKELCRDTVIEGLQNDRN